MLLIPASLHQTYFNTQQLVGGWEPLSGGVQQASMSCWIKINNIINVTRQLQMFGGYFGVPFKIQRNSAAAGQPGDFVTVQWTGTGPQNIGYSFHALLGWAYHLAMTFDGTTNTQKFWVNGTLVQTNTTYSTTTIESETYTSILVGTRDSTPGSGDGNGIDYYLDDPTIWSGYLLTQSDVNNILNQNLRASQIAVSNLAWAMKTDYTAPVNVALGDPSLIDATGLGHNLIQKQGQPVGYPGRLTYVAPAAAPVRICIGTSGQTLCLGTATNITAIGSNPTIQVNGGNPVTLSGGAVWDPSTPQPYAVWGLPSGTTVNPGDVVTLTNDSNWITTLGGKLAARSGVPIENSTGTELVGQVADTAKTMKVGMNVATLNYWATTFVYNNQVKLGGDWRLNSNEANYNNLDANGYPADLSGGSVWMVVSLVTVNGGLPSVPEGIWILQYDGNPTGTRLVAMQNTILTQISVVTSGSTTTVTYNVKRGVGQNCIGLNATCTALPLSNLKVYPPGADLTGSSLFHPWFMSRLQNFDCIRMMGLLNIPGSNVSEFSEMMPVSLCSYAADNVGLNQQYIVYAQTYSNPNNFFSPTNRYLMLLTTASPHGFVTGQQIKTGTIAPINVIGSEATSNISGWAWVIEVVNSTQFAMSVWSPGTGGTVPGQVVANGPVSVSLGTMIPISHCIQLVNSLPHADLWYNIPALASDDFVNQATSYIASNLAVGRKCHLEYSNENWNYSGTYTETAWLAGIAPADSSIQGILSGTPSQGQLGNLEDAKKTAHVHSLALAQFTTAGRTSDLRRVLGGQFTNTYLQGTLFAWYAANPSYAFDEFAIAPYYNLGPQTTSFNTQAGSVINNWNHSMLHDATQMWLMFGNFFKYVAQHYQALQTAYPGTNLVCYEGGQQVGAVGCTNASVLSRYWGKSPRMVATTLYYLQQLQNNGVALHCHFIFNGAPGTTYVSADSNWGIYLTAMMLPGAGDGSDGLYDNRLDMQLPSENPMSLLTQVAPVAYALNIWKKYAPGSKRRYHFKYGSNYIPIDIQL